MSPPALHPKGGTRIFAALPGMQLSAFSARPVTPVGILYIGSSFY